MSTRTDLEQELDAAARDGNWPLVDELERKLAHHPPPTPSLAGAALWYGQHGHRVFPLTPGAKKPPLVRHGLHDAATDPYTIRRWWDRWPNANIGIATGHRFDVVDIDGPQGQRNRAQHWEVFGPIDELAYAKVITPRAGGMHIYVPPIADAGNRARIADLDGLDYRGHGGYVVAPPSATDVGAYRFLGTPDLEQETQT